MSQTVTSSLLGIWARDNSSINIFQDELVLQRSLRLGVKVVMEGALLNLSSLKDKIKNKIETEKTSQAGGREKKNNKEKNSKKEKKREPEKRKEKQQGQKENDILRKEALELGATEEDLKLVEGLSDGDESEKEFSQMGGGNDKRLQNDLRAYMGQLGIDKAQEQDENEGVDSSPKEGEDDNEYITNPEDETAANDKTEDGDDGVIEKEIDKKQLKQESSKSKKSDFVDNLAFVQSKNLVIPSRTDWFNVPLEEVKGEEKLDKFQIDRLFDRAKGVVDKENQAYFEEFSSNSSQKKFLTQVLTGGTLGDKISALTLLTQESPLHNIKSIDTLLSYCEKKSRTAALQAINAFKDLLINDILPDRKLVPFAKQPLNNKVIDAQLAIYYFEDYLKKAYFRLLGVLENLSRDTITYVRSNILTHIFDLLRAKPEQEFNLLRLGVNKLGDIDNKVASKASYQVLKLEQAHPAMKKVIIDAVIEVIVRNNNDYHSRYYSVITLNQTILTKKETELANLLIKTYFGIFEKVLVESGKGASEKEDKVLGDVTKGRKDKRKNPKKGKKGGISQKGQKTQNEVLEEMNNKLFSALLTGLNRAFPFSDMPSKIYEDHLDVIFKITHSANFNTSVQALILIHHIVTSLDLNPDRFYQSLYESLMDTRLMNSSKQGIYLNLLFKALKNDPDVSRVLAFIKRIVQICCHWLNVGSATGMFYLLIQLSKSFPGIKNLITGKASVLNSENMSQSDQNSTFYDPRKRNPKYANADKTLLWELHPFLDHYHPTISVYATSLLEGTDQLKPDLNLFTLAHFLDKFVYRNPKQKPVAKGASIMQPLGGAHTGSLLVKSTNLVNEEVPANAYDWLNRKVEEIRPEDKFFYQYFSSKTSRMKTDKRRTQEEEPDEEMNEDDIWQALVKSKPDVEADSDDEGLSDLDEEDFSDMDMNDETEEANDATEESPIEEEEEVSVSPADIGEAKENEEEDAGSDDGLEAFRDDEDESGASSEEDNERTSTLKRSSAQGDLELRKSKRMKLKSLPVFASAEDYTEYLKSDEDSE